MKKSACFAGVLVALLFAGKPASSQNHRDLMLEVDGAAFKSASGDFYLEIFYSIRQSHLTFVRRGANQLAAEALVQMRIFHADSLWLEQAWRMPCTLADTVRGAKSLNSVDVIRYAAKPGAYRLEVSARDMNDLTKADSVVTNFDLPELADAKVALSDIELASSIKKIEQDVGNVFYKNTLEVIPNPSRLYGEGLPMLYYYVEGYNLASGPIADKYKTLSFVSVVAGDTARAVSVRKQAKNKIGNTSVEVGAVNVAALPTGTYHLNFAIMDAGGNQLAFAAKKFFVYNPAVPNGQTVHATLANALALSPFAAMAESDLDQEFDYAAYLMAKEGVIFYKSLKTVEAKREFLFSFWQASDPAPATAANQRRASYLQRVEHANAKFQALGNPGWKTDRGRVYLIYGQPNRVDPFPSTTATKPYEVWSYYGLEGGVEFVFADVTGFKNYRLVHSTKLGEVKNENWLELIREHAR